MLPAEMKLWTGHGVLRIVTTVQDKEEVEWEIKDFFDLPTDQPCNITDSPFFAYLGEIWRLRICCEKCERPYGLGVSLHLLKHPSPSEVSVLCTTGIKRANGSSYNIFNLREKYTNVNFSYRVGCFRFHYGFDLMNEGGVEILDNTLRVYCIFHSNECGVASKIDISQSPFMCGHGTLPEDLRESFITGSHSDVKISVKGKEFSAHKMILAARSAVFRSMLELDMKEKNDNFINITDCDPESFENFLLFLYSGKLDIVSPSNALSLYAMSDKYNVEELKKLCATRLAQSVSVNSVLDVIQLAFVYNETDLLDTAKEFLKENANTIFRTPKWFSFMTENPSLANELLIQMTDI